MRQFKPLFIPALLIALMMSTSGPAVGENPVRTASLKEVMDCAGRVAVGTTREVSYDWKALCNKSTNTYQRDHAFYSLTRLEGPRNGANPTQLFIGIHAQIILDTANLRALERTRDCMPLLNQYWNRYGVSLDFDFKLKDATTSANTPNTIAMMDAAGRSNSKTFFFYGLDSLGPTSVCLNACKLRSLLAPGAADRCKDDCETVRQKEYCNMAVHEFGHRLGLPDEYEDKTACPDREFISSETYPWSIMATPQVGILDTPGVLDTQLAEFFPRHLKQVVAPLCEGASPSPTPPPSP